MIRYLLRKVRPRMKFSDFTLMRLRIRSRVPRAPVAAFIVRLVEHVQIVIQRAIHGFIFPLLCRQEADVFTYRHGYAVMMISE